MLEIKYFSGEIRAYNQSILPQPMKAFLCFIMHQVGQQ